MGKNPNTVRFGVGKPEGPRASVWLLSTSKKDSDVFITGSGFRRSQKITLHKSGKWRHAFMEGSPFVAPGEDRATDKWERPPEIAPGVIKAFEIIVPASEVTIPTDLDTEPDWKGKDIVWIPAPPKDFVTYFTVVYTAPELLTSSQEEIAVEVVEGQNRYLAHPISPRIELPNNQSVWILTHNRPITQEQKEQLRSFGQAQDQARHKIGAAKYSALPEPRFYFYGHAEDGTRFYIDVSGAHIQN